MPAKDFLSERDGDNRGHTACSGLLLLGGWKWVDGAHAEYRQSYGLVGFPKLMTKGVVLSHQLNRSNKVFSFSKLLESCPPVFSQIPVQAEDEFPRVCPHERTPNEIHADRQLLWLAGESARLCQSHTQAVRIPSAGTVPVRSICRRLMHDKASCTLTLSEQDTFICCDTEHNISSSFRKRSRLSSVAIGSFSCQRPE